MSLGIPHFLHSPSKYIFFWTYALLKLFSVEQNSFPQLIQKQHDYELLNMKSKQGEGIKTTIFNQN